MKKKAVLMVLTAALLVAASVGGTLAYLTATTKTISNVFTTGNISSLKLDEALVDEDGHKITGPEAGRIDASNEDRTQNYPLYPGAVLDKDPTVTVGADSEPCYVFVKYTTNLPTAASVEISDNWIPVEEGSRIYVYTTDGENPAIVTANVETPLPALFTKIEVDGNWVGEAAPAGGYNITVKAYAHQAIVDGEAAPDTAIDAAEALFNS